jgi:C-terminal processing protease CtpA/Prc
VGQILTHRYLNDWKSELFRQEEAIPGTPAAQAGLKPGDVVTKLDGNAIEDAADLTRGIASFKPGDKDRSGHCARRRRKDPRRQL